MPKPFPDRRDSLFGRAPDLSHLLDRAGRKGMTAVVARAQMGKTWLLEQLARELGEEPHRCLVGYFETHGEGSDALLRVVSDLYTRWLSDASSRQQARMVWDQQRNDLLARFSLSLGHVLDKIAASLPIAKVVEEALQGMVSANQTLRSGGLELKPLQYEQARELVALVAQVSARPVALVLDGWEKTSSITVQAGALDAILRHFDDWPHVHIFLGLRPENGADGHVEDMQQAYPGMAELYSLPRLHLDAPLERQRLLAWLREEIPATRAAGEDELIAMIDGHAGVISRWQGDAAPLVTADDLRQRADQANRYLYKEFDRLLPDLPDDSPARRLAMRLAIFPTANPRFWDLVKRALLDKIDEAQLDSLVQHNILESAEPPSYGHDKRWEAARQWCYQNWRVGLKREAEAAVFSMAAQVRDVEERSWPFASALAALITDMRAWNLPPLPQALCQCAASLLGQRDAVDTDNLLSEVRNADPNTGPDTHARKDAGALIAMGLLNTLRNAKGEEERPRRDELLEALRGLAAQYPDDAAVRKQLAKGLLNTLNDAKAEEDLPRRDALLEALWGLAAQCPDDAAVREPLAMGLFNTLNHAQAKEDLPQRDALLEALRGLAAQYPDDASVRERLAKGLFNTLSDAKTREDLSRRDALLEALRGLAAQYPDDAAVRESLVKGLFNTFSDAKAEEDLPRRDALLDELRGLAAQYPDDAAVREPLAKGLLNTLNDAKAEEDLPRRDVLLDELQGLVAQYPDDAAVRELLAMGLVNTLYHAKAKEDLPRRDALLEALRGLAAQYPDDATVRERLVMGLVNTLHHAKAKEDLPRRDALLSELNELIARFSDESVSKEIIRRLL